MSQRNATWKILIYGEYFLPVVGGVQTAMNLLARGLSESKSGLEKDAIPGEIEVTVVTRTAANGMDDSTFPYRVIRRPRLWSLIKLLRSSDVLHLAGPCLLPMAIGWLIRKPIIVEHHGYQAICPNGLLLREPSRTVCPGYFGGEQYGKCVHCVSNTTGFLEAIRALMLTFPRNWLCKKVQANITITNHVAARLKLPRMRTVYYGIEQTPMLGPDRLLPFSKKIELACVGRLVPEKGLPVLLHAATYLKNDGVSFRLSFIGDGPERKCLEELADRLGLCDFVHFIGDLRGSELDRAVANVAVVVMPSIWEETAGLSAIEQMMRGRLVIVADIGGLSEVVGDAGLKFAPGDAKALAACIMNASQNESLVASMGSEARARAERLFNVNNTVLGHISAYRDGESR